MRGSYVDNSVALVSLRRIGDKVINRLTTKVAELLVIGATDGSPVTEKLAYFMGEPRGKNRTAKHSAGLVSQVKIESFLCIPLY